MSNTQVQYVVHCENTQSFWVKEEGFSAESAKEATKFDYTEASKLAMQFWKAGAKVQEVSS